MSYIDASKCEQRGGWFGVQIIHLDEITNSPTILTNDNASKLQISPNVVTIDILPVRESIKIKAFSKRSVSGTSYNIKAEFEVYTQLKEVDSYFNACIHEEVVLLAQKFNGQQVLFGSLLCPLDFSYHPIHGTRFEDGQGFKVFIKGEIPQKPVFI